MLTAQPSKNICVEVCGFQIIECPRRCEQRFGGWRLALTFIEPNLIEPLNTGLTTPTEAQSRNSSELVDAFSPHKIQNLYLELIINGLSFEH